MTRTISYLVLITRTPQGYVASTPAFPDLNARASSARVAYARLKASLKARLLSLLAGDAAVPHDPVVQTKQLRLDLWYLRQQEELQ